MSEDITSTIKRYESTAEFYRTKANREWAYAVNGQDGYHYNNARQAYNKAAQFQAKADALKVPADAKKDLVIPNGHINYISDAAKVGGAINGVVALTESVVNGDDFQTTTQHVSSRTINGAISGASSTLVADGAMKAVSLLPIPTVAKVILVAGTAVVAGSVTAEATDDFCEGVGDIVSDVVSDITDGIETIFDVLTCLW